jgi:hypothetical protein
MDWTRIEKDDAATERVVVLGNGSAKINLSAGGDVRVSNRADAGESAEDFGNFAGVNFDWSGFRRPDFQTQVEEATRRAAKRAEEAAAGSRSGMLNVTERRGFKGGLVVGRWNWDLKGVPKPPGTSSADGSCIRGGAHGDI